MSYSYNQNFYNNFHGNTFQNASQFLPPPPPPPAYFIPPQLPLDTTKHDANFIKQFEFNLPRKQTKPKSVTISSVREEVSSLLLNLNELKSKERMLSDKLHELSDEEWDTTIQQIEQCKAAISEILSNINNLDLEVLKKLLAKRTAKRSRLKRLRSERKKEKDEWIKEMLEKSRKIDEKLQKVQDDIRKAKQEEEAKIQADMVLKETLRKKHDAKKFVVKLGALMKLRIARQNTARGRGEAVSQAEADVFNNNIEKLKTLWKQRLVMYEKEEARLRAKLDEDTDLASVKEVDGGDYLEKWMECLFGGSMPQVDFSGDIPRFISVRCEWDELITCAGDGSYLPVGWLAPSLPSSDI